MALSSTEAEYIIARLASCEAIWLHKMRTGLLGLELDPIVIRCDDQSCIKLLKNPVFHDRSKHIQVRYHFVRYMVARGLVKPKYISTYDQVADILTKPLFQGKFLFYRDKLGVV